MDAPQQIEYNQSSANGNGGDSSIRFDSLGPVIINENGTMSRITNWALLSPEEQSRILRILPQRNARRLAQLRNQETPPTTGSENAAECDKAAAHANGYEAPGR